jgi:hypothetical protein
MCNGLNKKNNMKKILLLSTLFVAALSQAQIPCVNGERKDIINFYNDVYIKSMKAYIIALKDSPA